VLLQSGHTQEGKPENQRLAANLAMKGFVALCFDPIGQGERVQTYSQQLNEPLAGWSVPEHIQMAAQAQLIGEGLSRYFIWDAMRSSRLPEQRPDVDALPHRGRRLFRRRRVDDLYRRVGPEAQGGDSRVLSQFFPLVISDRWAGYRNDVSPLFGERFGHSRFRGIVFSDAVATTTTENR